MKQNKNELIGQYASDWAIQGLHTKDSTGTLEARGNGDHGFHQENVYGTAEADSSEGSYSEDIHVREGDDVFGKDVLGVMDAADKWLQDNDPTGHKPEDYR